MARQLEENGIKLRAPEPEDLDCMFRFENIVDLWDISNTTGPYSRFHLKQYIEQTQNDLFTDRQLRLMIENSDRQVVGIVDICNFDPLHSRAEVGIVIDEAQRRKGIGRQALSLLESHCFHYLGIHQLFAYVDTANKPCRKLFTTCGYQECALLKDWMRTGKSYRDVIMLQKINF
jgi:diamine N-acetyltransferase